MTNIQACEHKKKLSKKINVDGLKKIIKKYKNDFTRIIFFSSTSVFNGKKPFVKENDIRRPLNNYGNHSRDFTHIDDAINIVIRLMNVKEKNKFNVFNISSNNPINLKKIIQLFKDKYKDLDITLTKKNKLDVKKTHGCNRKVLKLTKYRKKNFAKLSNKLESIITWYTKNKIYKIT